MRCNGTAEKQGKGGFLLLLGLKISSSILAPLAISFPLYEFTTAIRAWPNHTQPKKKKNYHDAFCCTSLFTTPFSLVWFWGSFFWLVLFLYNTVFMHCTVQSPPTVTMCTYLLQHQLDLSYNTPPQWVPLSSSDLHNRVPLHLTRGTRCPKQKPLEIKTSFSADMAKV